MLLAGCGKQIAAMSGIAVTDQMDAAAVSSATQIQPNQHTGMTEIVGPVAYHDQNILGRFYILRAWKGQDGKVGGWQFVVTVPSKDWQFLDQAYSMGAPLKTNVLDRKVGHCGQYGCQVYETVGVAITDVQARQCSEKGFLFQVRGQRGSSDFSIPSPYCKGVLQKSASA